MTKEEREKNLKKLEAMCEKASSPAERREAAERYLKAKIITKATYRRMMRAD